MDGEVSAAVVTVRGDAVTGSGRGWLSAAFWAWKFPDSGKKHAQLLWSADHRAFSQLRDGAERPRNVGEKNPTQNR